MLKLLITVPLVLFLVSNAWPQEESTGSEAAAAQVAEVAADDTPEIDDSDLDEQTYEEDDDDFVPSEEIPTDVPIPFPSNI